jgi:CRP-like cAMP-binding protein
MFVNKNSDNELSLKVLSGCPLFSGLRKSELKTILRTAHIRDYSADEKVFTEGTTGLCFYIVGRGSVEIISESEQGGREKTLKAYGEGGYFSEAHLFCEINHTVSCVSRELTRLIIFTKPDFEDLVKTRPKIANKLMLKFLELMGEQLEELYKQNKSLLLSNSGKTQ